MSGIWPLRARSWPLRALFDVGGLAVARAELAVARAVEWKKGGWQEKPEGGKKNRRVARKNGGWQGKKEGGMLTICSKTGVIRMCPD